MDNKIFKLILFIVLVIDLLLGLLCIACGLWFNASPDIHAYITVFVRSQNDQTLLGAAGILLAVGFILSLLVLIAGFGLFTGRYSLVKLFLCLVWIVSVLGLVCGFMCVGFKYNIHIFVKQGMLDQLQNRYSWNSTLGMAWNRVQVKKRCCGVDGSWDYRDSDWFVNLNQDLVDISTWVPPSCCVLNFNQDQLLYWVDPQNLQLKDLLRCNQDAEGYKDGSANLHGKGCFAALFAVNKDLWHDQSIFTVMDVISGVGISTGLYQIIAMVLTCSFLNAVRSNNDMSKKQLGRY